MIIIGEQEPLSDPDSIMINEAMGSRCPQHGFMDVPEYLGINRNGGKWWSSYYIGACNLPDGLPDLVVLPKFANLDFMAMLAVCVSHIPSAEYFGHCYGIDNSGRKIECGQIYDILSPMLAMHYVLVLNQLVGKGLARSYVDREENIKSKVKGRIHTKMDWKKNELYARRDRVYCHFSEYSEDIPVNRLLKKALLIADGTLNRIASHSVSTESCNIRLFLNRINNAFINVDGEKPVSHVVPHRRNKLNLFYSEAISLAGEIISHKENSISRQNNRKKFVRPFWIDMSRLFEVYVLAKLQDKYGSNIEFQVAGNKACADYVNRADNQIIDAKYKPVYRTTDYDINDIRELSGNARDNKICSRFLDKRGEEPDCVIVYPDPCGVMEFGQELLASDSVQPIPQFRRFYKIGVSLPGLRVTDLS